MLKETSQGKAATADGRGRRLTKVVPKDHVLVLHERIRRISNPLELDIPRSLLQRAPAHHSDVLAIRGDSVYLARASPVDLQREYMRGCGAVRGVSGAPGLRANPVALPWERDLGPSETGVALWCTLSSLQSPPLPKLLNICSQQHNLGTSSASRKRKQKTSAKHDASYE